MQCFDAVFDLFCSDRYDDHCGNNRKSTGITTYDFTHCWFVSIVMLCVRNAESSSFIGSVWICLTNNCFYFTRQPAIMMLMNLRWWISNIHTSQTLLLSIESISVLNSSSLTTIVYCLHSKFHNIAVHTQYPWFTPLYNRLTTCINWLN